ncbi:MAG: alpha-L-arabinofuranosidase, partial [Alistipes sp.]|nr:alpha-L-arabinofuranosidase [Alistipes sp.]
WFLTQGNRYDDYPRKGTKVFAGEYACHGRGKKWNHFHAALCEAAFMTGLERNADVVEMATYAPLFAHIDGWQWRPDLIWFDNLRSFRSCSYYVQQLFACNRGTHVLPLVMDGRVVSGQEGQDGLFASAVIDDGRHEIIVKVVNTSSEEQPLTLQFDGKTLRKGHAYEVVPTTFTADNPDGENTLDAPERYVPVTGTPQPIEGNRFETVLAPASVNLYRIVL